MLIFLLGCPAFSLVPSIHTNICTSKFGGSKFIKAESNTFSCCWIIIRVIIDHFLMMAGDGRVFFIFFSYFTYMYSHPLPFSGLYVSILAL